MPFDTHGGYMDEQPAADSQEELLVMDEMACSKAAELIKSREDSQASSLRLFLDGKGCDGFYYGISFDKKKDDDLEFIQVCDSRVCVIVDPTTYEFVKGSAITWHKTEEMEGFLVENPRHKRYRGKFYKRGFWKEKLQEMGENQKNQTNISE